MTDTAIELWTKVLQNYIYMESFMSHDCKSF